MTNTDTVTADSTDAELCNQSLLISLLSGVDRKRLLLSMLSERERLRERKKGRPSNLFVGVGELEVCVNDDR